MANVDGFAGTFDAGLVNIPAFTATGTFIVQGWYNTAGNYATLAAALAAPTGATYAGATSSFTAIEDQNPAPPKDLDSSAGWNGNLELQLIPEPGTITRGLGAAAFVLFRRRK